MTKIEMIDYLANISIILDAQEKMGLQRSKRLSEEYTSVWKELKKELEDEARKSNDRSGLTEEGADRKGSEPWRGQSVG